MTININFDVYFGFLPTTMDLQSHAVRFIA